MKFSLILATIGRTDVLKTFLASLQAQTHRDFEVIIIDQNEDERLRDIIANFQIGLRIVHLRSLPGISRARNIGLLHALGDVVCFPDDDCWYPVDLLEQVAHWFRNNEDYAFLSGCYSEPGARNPFFSSEPKLLSVCDMFKRTQFGSSITLFFRQHLFVEQRYFFNERLGVGAELASGEEIDLISRVLEDGFKGRYDPGFVVFHKVTRESNTLLTIKLARAEADTFVLATHAFRPHLYLLLLTAMRLLKPLIKGIYLKEHLLVARSRSKGFMKACCALVNSK